MVQPVLARDAPLPLCGKRGSLALTACRRRGALGGTSRGDAQPDLVRATGGADRLRGRERPLPASRHPRALASHARNRLVS
jgi:hypothetical protein